MLRLLLAYLSKNKCNKCDFGILHPISIYLYKLSEGDRGKRSTEDVFAITTRAAEKEQRDSSRELLQERGSLWSSAKCD